MQSLLNDIKILVYAVFIYLNIEAQVMELLFWVMLADTILGVLAALYEKKEDGSVKINLYNFSISTLISGLFAKFALLFIPGLSSLFLMSIGYDEAVWITSYAVRVIIASEVISGLSNIQRIRTGEEIKNKDYISKLIDKTKEFIQKYLEKLMNDE